MTQNLEQLKLAINDYQEIILCKRRMQTASAELREQKIKLKHLQEIVEKEHQDVLMLEKLSLKQLFSTLLVNKEAQLEKERQEYLLAAMNYNDCHNLIELLNYEKKILKDKLKVEKDVVDTFEQALDSFQPNKKNQASKEFILLKSFNEELKKIIQLKIEAQEALDVVNELKSSFKRIVDALEKANLYDEWGYFYKEKQAAKTKKTQYIDKAQAHVYIVKKQLIFLRSELLDVERFKGNFSEAKDILKGFNLHYYNDLLTDWINVMKLRQTTEHTLTTYQTISKLGRQLKKLIKETDQEYEILLIKRGTLIETIAG